MLRKYPLDHKNQEIVGIIQKKALRNVIMNTKLKCTGYTLFLQYYKKLVDFHCVFCSCKTKNTLLLVNPPVYGKIVLVVCKYLHNKGKCAHVYGTWGVVIISGLQEPHV